MGKVRSLHIKRAARELMEKYPDRFSEDFKKNRKVMDELFSTVGKPMRNRVAGYISTLSKQNEKE